MIPTTEALLVESKDVKVLYFCEEDVTQAKKPYTKITYHIASVMFWQRDGFNITPVFHDGNNVFLSLKEVKEFTEIYGIFYFKDYFINTPPEAIIEYVKKDSTLYTTFPDFYSVSLFINSNEIEL